jgi:hypothetical protein
MNKTLLEEIRKFKMMANYKPSNPNFIYEQNEKNPFDGGNEIPLLKGKDVKTGVVDLGNTTQSTGVSPIAKFKNKKMFPTESKWLYLFPEIDASRVNFKLTAYKKSQPEPDPEPEPEPDVVPIFLGFNLVDVFRFDRTSLTTLGETSYKKFIDDFKAKKEKNLDVWPRYINFLKEETKKNQLYLTCYASIDGDSNEIVADSNNSSTTTLPRCRVSGGRLRSEYNLCLSQARADDMLKRIEKDLPELKGIYKSRGMGETSKFGDNKTETTREPNRRLVMDKPAVFKYDRNNPNPNPNPEPNPNPNPEPEKSDINQYGDRVDEYGPFKDGEYIYFYCEWRPINFRDGKYFIKTEGGKVVLKSSRNQYSNIEAGWDTGGADWSVKKAIELCKASKQKTPDGYWKFGNYNIEYYESKNNASNITLREKDIEDVFGSMNKFNSLFPSYIKGSFNGTLNPTVSIFKNGATIKGADNMTYTLNGWSNNSEAQKSDYSNLYSTEFIPVVVQTNQLGEYDVLYEMGVFGLNISKPMTRFKG